MTQFEEGIAVARAIAEEYGIPISELRAYASDVLADQWPKGHGIGSSDVSYQLSLMGREEPERLRQEAARLRERNAMVARVAANTGKSEEETLKAFQRLLDPAPVGRVGAAARGLNGASVSLYTGDDAVPDGYVDLVVSSRDHTAGIVMPPADVAKLTGQLADALRDRFPAGVVAEVLTPAQQRTVELFRAALDGQPVSWFVGQPDADGRVEVLALGAGFVWSIRVAPDGEESYREASVGKFSVSRRAER